MKPDHLINHFVTIENSGAIPAFPLHWLNTEDRELYLLKKKGDVIYDDKGNFKAVCHLVGCGQDKLIKIEGQLESPFWMIQIEKASF